MFRCKQQCINALETCQRHVPTLWRYRLSNLMRCFYQETILSLGVFRRETASGFYPWSKVESPRKRVAVGLCGWRHGNSFPMTQSAQSHRQMRSIPLCPKAVFYVFVFDSIHDSATMHNLYPQSFSAEPLSDPSDPSRPIRPFGTGAGLLGLSGGCGGGDGKPSRI